MPMRAQTGAIRLSARAGKRDMSQRVGAFVAMRGGVGRGAAAHRVEHDEKGAAHCATTPDGAASMRKAAANSARV